MKKTIAIIAILLLIAGAAYARMTVVGTAGNRPADHDCSGTKIFGWSAENLTLSSGNPAGCSDDGDLTGTISNDASLTADPYDGTYSVLMRPAGGYSRIYFSLTDLPSAFTVRCFFKIITWDNDTQVISGVGTAGTDHWYIEIDNLDDIKAQWEGQDVTATLASTGLSLDTHVGWVFVQAAFDPSRSATDIFFGVDTDLDGTWDFSASSGDITAFTAGSYDSWTLYIGRNSSDPGVLLIDKIEIFSGYITDNPL